MSLQRTGTPLCPCDACVFDLNHILREQLADVDIARVEGNEVSTLQLQKLDGVTATRVQSTSATFVFACSLMLMLCSRFQLRC